MTGGCLRLDGDWSLKRAFDAASQHTGIGSSLGVDFCVYKIKVEGVTIPHLQGLGW